MNEQKTKLRTFLARHFGQYQLGDDEDIFASGIVQSLFAMQLIVFLENGFGIVIESEDLELSNFRTINAMVALVARKLQPVKASS